MKSEKIRQTAAWVFDLRVRDRMLKSGQLDPKTLQAHLDQLPDGEATSELVPYDQPALGRPGSHSDGGL